MLDYTPFKDLMAGIESGMVALAVFGAAIWGLFTFNALAARRRALAEVADLERRLERQAVVTVKLRLQQFVVPASTTICLDIDVELSNLGSSNTLFYLPPTPVMVTECVPTSEAVIPIAKTSVPIAVHHYQEEADGRIPIVVRAGSSWRFSTVTTVPRPGLYHVVVNVILSSSDAAVARKAGLDVSPFSDIIWDDSAYIVLRPVTPDGKTRHIAPPDSQIAKLVDAIDDSMLHAQDLVQGTGKESNEARAAATQLLDWRRRLAYEPRTEESDREISAELSSAQSHYSHELARRLNLDRLRIVAQEGFSSNGRTKPPAG